MAYKIKGWAKFQHFRDRKPPWIKLYRDILDDLDWHELDPLAAKSLVSLWLLASESDGVLPDIKNIAFRLRMSEKQAKSIVSQLSHWLEQDDITVISDRYQNDSLEREIETEIERETDTCRKRSAGSAEFEEFWKLYPRQINKAMAQKAFAKATAKATPELICEAVKNYQFSEDQQYIPHPATWLNQERWEGIETSKGARQGKFTQEQLDKFEQERLEWLKEFNKAAAAGQPFGMKPPSIT